MKNNIRVKGKIYQRRTKNLKSGEIQCHTCGEWKRVPTFTDKHFIEEYTCRTCKKELKEPASINTKPKTRSNKLEFPDSCPHRVFFWCKKPSECIGCYYNPDKKIALIKKDEDDPNKSVKTDWFYGNKKQAKLGLQNLEDIKNGKGLFKNGNRYRMKHSRKQSEEDDE